MSEESSDSEQLAERCRSENERRANIHIVEQFLLAEMEPWIFAVGLRVKGRGTKLKVKRTILILILAASS